MVLFPVLCCIMQKNPSSLDVIHRFDVYSHPLMKISHGREIQPCVGFAADISHFSGVLDVTILSLFKRVLWISFSSKNPLISC